MKPLPSWQRYFPRSGLQNNILLEGTTFLTGTPLYTAQKPLEGIGLQKKEETSTYESSLTRAQ